MSDEALPNSYVLRKPQARAIRVNGYNYQTVRNMLPAHMAVENTGGPLDRTVISIQIRDTPKYLHAKVGEWVVIDPYEGVTTMTHQDFHQRYKPEEAGA